MKKNIEIEYYLLAKKIKIQKAHHKNGKTKLYTYTINDGLKEKI